MEDSQILALFLSRSEDALQETDKKYGAYLHTLAGNLLQSREDAEEAVEDTYWKAWKSIPPEQPRSLKHYLSRIARNCCLDRLDYLAAGKRGSLLPEPLSELEECLPDRKNSTEALWDARQVGELLNRFLAGLSGEDRRIFLSRYYYALPIRRIAERSRLSERQIKYRLRVTRNRLKEHLEKEGVIL